MKNRMITTANLSERLGDRGSVLIDVRPIEAYNGWSLRDERRGGHITGARTFPLSWIEYADWHDVLKMKQIRPDASITVYGYTTAEADRMVDELRAAGYSDIGVYAQFEEWSADDALPMDRLQRHKQLVYPEWVKALIDGKNPASYAGRQYVICHAAYGYREDYEAGHIPGAQYLDTLSLESPETWNRRSPEELRRALLDLGIRHDSTVVLYGRFSHPNNDDPYPGQAAGHLASIRCALIMLYAGVADVRVLNGGMAAWERAGFEVTTKEGQPRRADDFGRSIPAHPEYIIDTPEAKQLLASDDGELVSVRSWDEFIGDASGYNYMEKAGRIPGAVFGNSGSDAYHMENYRNIDHTVREFHEVAANWARTGVVPEKHIAFYCGTGWRASEAFLSAFLMGWPRVSVYDGGWFEWSNDPRNPIDTGVPT